MRPCSSHWLRDLCQRVPDLSEPIRASRPLTASHTASHGLSRPLIASASQNLSHLSEPQEARPLTRTRPHTICHVICLSQQGMQCTRPHTGTRPRSISRLIGIASLESPIGPLTALCGARPRVRSSGLSD